MSGRRSRSRSLNRSRERRGSRDRPDNGYGTYSSAAYDDRRRSRDRRDSRDRRGDPPAYRPRGSDRRNRSRSPEPDYRRSPDRRGGGPIRRRTPPPPRRLIGPYDRPPPEPLDDSDPELLRVGPTTLPQRVAGAIAQRMRKAEKISLEASGSLACHQALKSCAIARTYLEEDSLDLSVQLEWLDSSRYHSGEEKVMKFLIFDHKLRPYRMKAEHPMKVAAWTKPEKTAGAIAMDIRSDVPCSVSALGAESVYQGLRAMILARSFLSNEKLDFEFQPFYLDPDSNVLCCHIERI
eukprot:EG_transcript_21245